MGISGSQPALMYALSGVMRAGASRTGYMSGSAFLQVGGVHVGTAPAGAGRTLIDSLRVVDALGEEHNRCSFTLLGTTPALEDEVYLTLGSKSNLARLFAGHIIEIDRHFLTGTPAVPAFACTAVDYTRLLDFTRVSVRYVNTSATDIAIALVQLAAVNHFSAARVQPGLPFIDEMTFLNETVAECLSRLAKRIGAYWYCDPQKVVHVYFEELDGTPTPLTVDHPTLADPTYREDDARLTTRVQHEGGGVEALIDVGIGSPTLPVEHSQWYAEGGGTVVSGPQQITYSSLDVGGEGALVGPGIGPTSAPTLTVADGVGITPPGLRRYVITYLTGSGETFPSPVALVATGVPLTNPTLAPYPPTSHPTNNPYGGSFVPVGDTVAFRYAFSSVAPDAGVPLAQWPTTLASPSSVSTVTVSNNDPLNPHMSAPIWVRVPAPIAPGPISIVLWMYSQAHGKWGVKQTARITAGADYTWINATGTGGYPAYDPPYWMDLPTSNTTGSQNRVQVGLPLAPFTTVGSRKIYRSVAGGTQPKLLATIADNTTTSYLDVLPDSSLGANAPTADTSGLGAAGQVPAKSTSLVVSGTGAFLPTGGWALLGGVQFIRYAGIDAATSSLIGIPPVGDGSLKSTVAYNTSIIAVAMLKGIPTSGPGSIQYGILQGDPVHLLVTVDDLAAQAALAARTGGDGIITTYLQDSTLSETECRARAQAALTAWAAPVTSVRYRCRDLRTTAGKTITIQAPMPLPAGAFKIQSVTIDNFRPYPNQYPTYTVEASNQRFTFEDLLRRARG